MESKENILSTLNNIKTESWQQAVVIMVNPRTGFTFVLNDIQLNYMYKHIIELGCIPIEYSTINIH